MTLNSEVEIQDAVRSAKSSRTPLRIVGGGTRACIGRPIDAQRLSTAGLSGVTLYEPAEMVIGAKAGTPLREIQASLAEKRQMLPFEPMDHRALLGTSGEPTIGAIAACNISGSRRISAGAARDSLIGVRFVNGVGDVIKSGGRVMKNVTGLDLVKLQAGAWGTLGVLTEVIFKLLPQPETSRTLILHGLDDSRAVAALSAALTTPFEVSGASHLPASAGQHARTCIRLEGFETSLKYRAKALSGTLQSFGLAEVLEANASASLWEQITHLAPLGLNRQTAVWRLSVKPTNGPKVVAAIKEKAFVSNHLYDWGGGLVWLEVPEENHASAAIIRASVAAHNGHATLIRGTEALRLAVASFQPQDPSIDALSAKIRSSIDPHALFNPGLMG